ncbi:hypothetical protein A5847_001853, partial [Enterococcus faecium]
CDIIKSLSQTVDNYLPFENYSKKYL